MIRFALAPLAAAVLLAGCTQTYVSPTKRVTDTGET